MNISKLIKKGQKALKKGKSRFSKKQIVVFLVFILFLIGFITIRGKRNRVEVETQKAKISTIAEGFTTSGEVESLEVATLTFPTAGQVSWVGVQEGDTVYAWQAVASLDTKTIELQLKKLLNLFERQFTNFDDTDDSVADLVLKDAVVRIKKRAQIDLDQTVLDVEIQNEAIRIATLLSPFKGIVTKTFSIFPGMNITPANQIITIANPDKVFFEADVNEVDVVSLVPGTKVEVVLDAFPEVSFEGKIERIAFSPTTTSTGGTAYKVEVSLPKSEDYMFRLGMGGDAEFVLSFKENVLTIPLSAILEEDAENFVWKVVGGKAQKQEIEIGISSLTTAEVISGIEEGDEIILRPSAKLTEGSRLAIKN